MWYGRLLELIELSSELECLVWGDPAVLLFGEVPSNGEGEVRRGREVGYGVTRTGTGTAILDFSFELVSVRIRCFNKSVSKFFRRCKSLLVHCDSPGDYWLWIW